MQAANRLVIGRYQHKDKGISMIRLEISYADATKRFYLCVQGSSSP